MSRQNTGSQNVHTDYLFLIMNKKIIEKTKAAPEKPRVRSTRFQYDLESEIKRSSRNNIHLWNYRRGEVQQSVVQTLAAVL